MKVHFLWNDPHRKARPELDEILRAGTDQLAIACAFCTAAGVEVLMKHADRLRKADSFVVVSAAPPTDLLALCKLYSEAPGSIYVNFGASSPSEVHVGYPLMHSKVFYARSGSNCLLWTGSHNLTASATQGLNCEAATLVVGQVDDDPIQEALAHLEACRDMSVPFDPSMAGGEDPPLLSEKTLIVHAESDTGPLSCGSFVHLCLPDASYDSELDVSGRVALYLYPRGHLQSGQPDPREAIGVYAGIQTAINQTDSHPSSAGIRGTWNDADYVIEEQHRVFALFLARPPLGRATTQSVFRVSGADESLRNARWLAVKPRVRMEHETAIRMVHDVDDDMHSFFRPRPNCDGSARVAEKRAGHSVVDPSRQDRLRQPDDFLLSAIGEHYLKKVVGPSRVEQKQLEGMRPFVYRAKYRLRG